jgi:putative heme-binding domain-containing protein
MFPELANPVQLNFDNQGRLWAACMPTYPQWRPGDPLPNDRLLIFTDTDGDGVADKVQTFADDLHCPVGFEFWNGGVLVISQPQLLWLKDTDGDDRADLRVVMLDGLASDDTHHACSSFEWTPDGRLVMLEGIAMSTAVETPWGPFRHRDKSAAYAFNPRTWKLEVHIEPCFANPWCYTHNDWGQGFVGDGTGAQQHWATPLSGARFDGRQGTRQWIQYDGPTMRPALGNEFLFSRHFPDEVQGNFLYACVINMNGILQFRTAEDGSSYRGERVEDLIVSTDANFRPGDPQIGPDGALYFVDWHNPLIGHMQYSQRDPNRDRRHGRIYRLSVADRPPLTPVTQFGKSIPELLEQFREYETRTRYRVRCELRARPTDEVVEAIRSWVAAIEPDDPQRDRLLTEALWVLEGHHALDRDLLAQVLAANTPEARCAAVHAVANQREYLSGAMQLVAPMIRDPHPRVRLEAVRALSFFQEPEAVRLTLNALEQPVDEELRYTIASTLAALRPLWVDSLADWAVEHPTGAATLQSVASQYAKSQVASALLGKLVSLPSEAEAERAAALNAQLLALQTSPEQGQAVFKRHCIACHRIGDEGADFGPNLSDVGKRLKGEEIIESIVDPNAKIDPKYRATNVITVEGKALSGLVVGQEQGELSLVLGDGKVVKIPLEDIEDRREVDVSSMPERLYESMSGSEFLDLIGYLRSLQTPSVP